MTDYPIDPDCIFCKIVAGTLPSIKVYEDETTLAFMDINPIVRGHTLIIPKGHYETVLDMTPDAMADTARTTRLVALAVQETLQPAGLNIFQANKAAGGQTVPHFHFHVLPREPGDGLQIKWPVKPGDMSVIQGIGQRLANAIAA